MNGASHKTFGYHGSYLHPYDGWDNEARKNIPGFIKTWNSGNFRKSNNAYGPGLYFVLDLNNARTGSQTQTGKGDYGNFIYKFELDVANYFIADQELILEFKSNASENYSKNIIEQLKIFGIKDFSGLPFDDPEMVEELIEEDFFSKIRSDLLVQKLSEKLSKTCDGAIFYTPDFGYMGVAYNLNSAQLKGYINRNELESEPEEKDYESSGASVLPKLAKLISALRKSGFHKEAVHVQEILKGPIDQKDWEEAAEEFGSEPISEDEYLKQIKVDPKNKQSRSGHLEALPFIEKEIFKIAEQNGVRLLAFGKFDSLGSGSFANVYRAIYNGKPAVAKIIVSYSNEVVSKDAEIWKKILSLKQRMPSGVAKHIPVIHLIIDDFFNFTDEFGDTEKFYYQILVMEELKHLPSEFMNSMKFGRPTISAIVDFINNFLNKLNSFILKRYNISDSISFNKMQEKLKEKYKINDLGSKEALRNISEYEIAKVAISILKEQYPQIFTNKKIFSAENKEKIYSMAFDLGGITDLQKFPREHQQLEDKPVAPELKSVLDALLWIRNESPKDNQNMVSWKDVHRGNLMMGADGEIKIVDVGGFEVIKKARTLTLSFLLKQANSQSIQTLGFPLIAAKLFSETLKDSYSQSVADKWDFVFAKFYLDDMGLSNFSDYKPSYIETHLATSIAALIIAKKLLFASDKDREDIKLEPFYRDFRNYTDRKGWGPQFFFEDTPETQFRPSTSSYSKLSSLIEELEEEIKHALKIRCENDFYKDLFANKVLPNTQAKSKTKAEVLKMWMDKVPRQAEVIFSIPTEDGEWRWVDVGRNSDWVRNIFKNCGNVSWEGLRATSESKKHAKMLALLDPMDVARAMVTWNPKYTEDYGKNPEMKKYLGGLEAPGSSILKPEYHKYFYDLVAALQPDIVNISNRAVSGRDAEGNYYEISNDPIRNTLREKGYKLRH